MGGDSAYVRALTFSEPDLELISMSNQVNRDGMVRRCKRLHAYFDDFVEREIHD